MPAAGTTSRSGCRPWPNCWTSGTSRRTHQEAANKLGPEYERRLDEALAQTYATISLPALFQHYDIAADDPACRQKLALCLAFAHVPGFGTTSSTRRGRPVNWTPAVSDKLFAAVEEAAAVKAVRVHKTILKAAIGAVEKFSEYAVLSTLSRDRSAAGDFTPAHGLIASTSRSIAQLQSLRSVASVRFATRGAPRSTMSSLTAASVFGSSLDGTSPRNARRLSPRAVALPCMFPMKSRAHARR